MCTIVATVLLVGSGSAAAREGAVRPLGALRKSCEAFVNLVLLTCYFATKKMLLLGCAPITSPFLSWVFKGGSLGDTRGW